MKVKVMMAPEAKPVTMGPEATLPDAFLALEDHCSLGHGRVVGAPGFGNVHKAAGRHIPACIW